MMTPSVETLTLAAAKCPAASVIISVHNPAETDVTVKTALGPTPWAGVITATPGRVLDAERTPAYPVSVAVNDCDTPVLVNVSDADDNCGVSAEAGGVAVGVAVGVGVGVLGGDGGGDGVGELGGDDGDEPAFAIVSTIVLLAVPVASVTAQVPMAWPVITIDVPGEPVNESVLVLHVVVSVAGPPEGETDSVSD